MMKLLKAKLMSSLYFDTITTMTFKPVNRCMETMFIKASIIDSKVLANVIDLLGKILRDGQPKVF